MIKDSLSRRASGLCDAVTLLQLTFIFCLLFFVFAKSADATVVYDSSAAGELTGSRSVADPGLTTTDPNDWGDAVISWVISDNGNGTFHYEYTFSGFNKPDISHVDIDISDDAIDDNALFDPGAVTGATLNGNTIPLGNVEFGDFKGITGAVKFDISDESATTLVYAFDSNRLPVYGHVFVKGNLERLENTGLSDPSSMVILDFIPRPNGVVPEPSSLLLVWAFGTVTVSLRRRRYRRAIAFD